MAKAASIAELNQMTQIRAQVQDAGDIQARLDSGLADAPVIPAEDSEEGTERKAKFGTLGALATAVAGGFILGPVGGLILGAAQGFGIQRERQNILDEVSSRENVYTSSWDVIDAELKELQASEGMSGDEDQQFLSTLESDLQIAREEILSGNPTLMERGAARIDRATGLMQSAITQNEEQRIVSNAAREQGIRDLTQEGYNRYKSALDDFNAETAPYEAIMRSTDVAMESLINGSPSDLWAAAILINKALDPTSVVRSEEAAAIAGQGNLLRQWMSKAEKLIGSGQGIDETTRKEFINLIDTIRTSTTGFQLSTERRYNERLDAEFSTLPDVELPQGYREQFKRVDRMPAPPKGPIREEGEKETLDALKQGDLLSAGGNIVESSLEGIRRAGEIVSGGIAPSGPIALSPRAQRYLPTN